MTAADRDPYRHTARLYDATVGRLNTGVLDAALRFRPPVGGERVLDIGCGTGLALERYRDAGCRVSGIDPSTAMLDRARSRLGESADLRHSRAEHLPFETGRFDLVTMSMVLHEIPEPLRMEAIDEARRVTAEAGVTLITEFRFGGLRGWRAPFIKAMSYGIEAVSGHLSGFLSFRAGRGLPGLAREMALTVAAEKILAGGNIAIYRLEGP